jgi:hypothetical protein
MATPRVNDEVNRELMAGESPTGSLLSMTSLARDLERENARLRDALGAILDWSPQPDPNDRPRTQERFLADLQKARDILSNKQ